MMESQNPSPTRGRPPVKILVELTACPRVPHLKYLPRYIGTVQATSRLVRRPCIRVQQSCPTRCKVCGVGELRNR